MSFADVVRDGARDDQRTAESRSMARLSSIAPLVIPFSSLFRGWASECFNRWLVATGIDLCLSKFGTEGVLVRVIVKKDLQTRAPHLHNSNLLEQNLQLTILHGCVSHHSSRASAGSCCVTYMPSPKWARSSVKDAYSCAADCSKFPTLRKASLSV